MSEKRDDAERPPEQQAVENRRATHDGRMSIWMDALYEHIARRLLNHQQLKDIAIAIGYSRREVFNIVRRPGFIRVYERVKQQVYGQIDEVLYDQRKDIVDRLAALQPVAFTQLVKMIEEGKGSGGGRASERARMEAIKLGMGLGGYVPVEKKLVAEIPTAKLNDDQMNQLVNVFTKAEERIEAEVVDVEPLPGKGGKE